MSSRSDRATNRVPDGFPVTRWPSLLLLGLLVTAGASPSAQTTTASLRGTVTDTTGAVLPDAVVEVFASRGSQTVASDQRGFYQLGALLPDAYTVSVSKDGFRTRVIDVLLALDRTITLDVQLDVAQAEAITVRADAPRFDRSRSSFSTVIDAPTIEAIPVNGRNYLDLIRLTPGVTVNDSAGASGLTDRDTRGAIFGARAGNTSFLIDGLWNNDDFGGGALHALSQDAVQEFEVIGAGYTAEFGQGSGGVINVITKSGGNVLEGSGYAFMRNDALDASNVEGAEPPTLNRYHLGGTIGGPVETDRAWYFGSVEHVTEDREALFPTDIPPVLAAREDFSQQPETGDTRLLGRYTRRLTGAHELRVLGGWSRLDQRNRLQSGTALPSASDDRETSSFLSHVRVTSQLSSRMLLDAMFGVRGQSLDGTADQDARSFSATFRDIGQTFEFGPPIGSVRSLDQRYYTGRGTLTLFAGAAHTVKAGGEYTRTTVDGQDSPGLNHVLVTSTANFARYGVDGFQIPQGIGFLTPADRVTDIRNNGGAVFLQDDWQPWSSVTVNLGVRYSVDSVFDDRDNVAPRLGVAWVPDDRTVVRASWGIYYDRYRLGIAHAVPELGGFNGRTVVELNYPRLVADAPPLGGSLGILGAVTGDPFVLHRAFGIPFDALVTRENITTLTGLTPDLFLAQLNQLLVSTGIPLLPVDFSPHTGFLRQDGSAAFQDEVRAATPFETPFNRTFSVGVERQAWREWTAGVTYVHRSIENILGLRLTNLSPLARVINFPITTDGGPLLRTYGPWYDGTYDALVLSIDTGAARPYRLAAHYTLTDATDNLLNPNLAVGIGTQGAGSVPTDNLDLEFDRGNSALTVRHRFLLSGATELPWQITVSGVAEATSGVFFSAAGEPFDYDGDGIRSRRPQGTRRNEFRGPATFNLDLRVEKRLRLAGGQQIGLLAEFFNLTNGRTPRVIDNGFIGDVPGPEFGTTRVPLPGREIQVGARYFF